jgi:two-component system, chemotaxis family, chemotaxis protein CheY
MDVQVPMDGGESQILVVDDDHDIRAVVDDLLTDEGYRVRTAGNGRQALEILTTWRPGVILLDLSMPEMNGWTFLAHQQADPELARIPVIVMSAQYNLRGGAALDTAAAVVAKPFDVERLLDLISAIAN